jgi:hypothetical protein
MKKYEKNKNNPKIVMEEHTNKCLVKIKGWIFVDDGHLLITLRDKPYWVEPEGYWRARNGADLLPRNLFPDMKQEDEPVEVIVKVEDPVVSQQEQSVGDDLEEIEKEIELCNN